jgi:hypothetical protein
MTISDPAQLLKRIPELELFVADGTIKRAIESGDPFKVYRALIWAKLQRRHPEQRATLNLLIKNRRLFSKPIKRAPSLSTINSVGFSFVGESESDSDGSYIALHALVILFAIPIIPLGSYLVSKTGSRQWKIYTRVPIGIVGWLYSRGLALLLLLTILGGAANGWHKSRTQDLMVLNGFSTPLDVVIGEQKQTIPAEGRAVFNVAVGNVVGRATTAKAGLIDDYQQTITSHAGYTIWNIAGATPLVFETINYYKTVPHNPPPNAQTIYCGQRNIDLGQIDFDFVEPPRSVSMDQYTSQVSKTYLDLYHDKKRNATELCLAYLMSKNQPAQIELVITAMAKLSDWNLNLTSNAVYFASNTSISSGVKLATQAAKANPENIDLQRLYQVTRDNSGDFEAMQQEYKIKAEQHPESATAQYLYAVLLEGAEGLTVMEQLAAKFDQDPRILRSLTWRRCNAGDFAGAIESYNRLKQISPQDALDVLDNEVEALVARNRSAEALHELAEAFHHNAQRNPGLDAGDYALIAQINGARPDELIDEFERSNQDKNAVDLMRIRAGYPSERGVTERSHAANLALALRNDPSKALQIADSIAPIELGLLQQEQIALLYCEAIRNNDLELTDRLNMLARLTSTDQHFLQQYIAGNPGSIGATNLELPFRAAADFARSRNPSLSLAEKSQLRDRAYREDVLHTVIGTALHQWPT